MIRRVSAASRSAGPGLTRHGLDASHCAILRVGDEAMAAMRNDRARSWSTCRNACGVQDASLQCAPTPGW